MNWQCIRIRAKKEAEDLLVAELSLIYDQAIQVEDSSLLFEQAKESTNWELVDLSGQIETEDVVILLHYPMDDSLEEWSQRFDHIIKTFEKQYGTHLILDVTEEVVEDQDWSIEWKKGYKPFRLTKHIVVKPSWESYKEKEGEIIIEIDPGMAFGTGTHATTSLCANLLEQITWDQQTVLDVGCGSGILSMVAAKCGARSVDAIDIDPDAVRTASENIRSNQLEQTVHVKEADLLKGITQQYDIVVANILADVIILLLENVTTVLKPEGILILSGIINTKAEEVKDALHTHGFMVIEELEMEDWVALKARRVNG